MDFAMLPPEVNSARMYAGPGPGPLLAAASAWDGLAAELHAVGMGYDSAISELATGWSGPSATAMAGAAEPYMAWMHSTAVQAEHTATQAKAATAAYEAAFAMTVPPPVVAANRSQLMALLATNFLGQNTPAIAATDAHYLEMWAQDAAAMYHYAGSAAAASSLTPFTEPPQTTNPAGSTSQAGAVGQAAATSAGSHTQTAITQFSTVPNALQSLTAPALGSTAPTAPGAASPLAGSALLAEPAFLAALAGVGVDSVGTFGVDSAGSFGVDVGGVGVGLVAAGIETGGVFPGWGLIDLIPAASAQPVTAGLGQAASVGALSVPQAWTAAAPAALQPVSAGTSVAATSAAAAPVVTASESAVPLAGMATAGVAGRALAGVAGRGRINRTGATPGQRPAAAKPPPSSRVQTIGADLRELAELREAGLLTQEEFAEEKRRLLGSAE